MRLGPSPEPATGARGEAGDVSDRRRQVPTVIILRILADKGGVAAGIFGDRNGVAQSIGALGQASEAQLEQAVGACEFVPVRNDRRCTVGWLVSPCGSMSV